MDHVDNVTALSLFYKEKAEFSVENINCKKKKKIKKIKKCKVIKNIFFDIFFILQGNLMIIEQMY